MSVAFLNGEFLPAADARVSPEDRGFLLGDGVFDTLRTFNGIFFRFDDHARRLLRGLEELRIAPPFDAAGLKKLLDELVARNGGADRVVRITISRGVGAGGYRMIDGARPTVYASVRDIPDVARLRREGVTLSISPVPRPLPFLSVVKTTSIGAMALARAISDSDEVVMLDAEGRVAEGASSTLFAIMGDRIVTPPSAHLLPATTRQVIEESFAVEERAMTPEEFLAADALFITATSTGPIPVRSAEGKNRSIAHSHFAKIFRAYDAAVAAECGSLRP